MSNVTIEGSNVWITGATTDYYTTYPFSITNNSSSTSKDITLRIYGSGVYRSGFNHDAGTSSCYTTSINTETLVTQQNCTLSAFSAGVKRDYILTLGTTDSSTTATLNLSMYTSEPEVNMDDNSGYYSFSFTRDADSDGVANALDAFPNDATETKDTDSDGVGDNGDDFPNDSNEWEDSDEDGYADNDDANWFDCYNGDDIAMNLVNDGNEDCSMGEDEHDSEPWMMFDNCTDMSSSSIDGGSMWECFVDMDDDGPLTSEESMGMWYICEMITMVDGDRWSGEPEPQHNEDGLSEEAVSMFFDAADADGDGMLTATEFSLLYSVFASGDDGPSPEVFHAITDSDGDGEVTASEYSEFLNASGVSGIEFSDVEAMIETYDEDSSGGLNVDELEVMFEETGGDDDHYVFYCSNDGEEYANSMGGILCPEGAGVVPTCPDGELCVCIDVDGSCTDGDDDWGYEDHGDGGHDDDHDGHDDGGHDDHDDGDHDDHDMHAVFDWTVVSTDMMTVDEIDGDFADYHIVLSLCMMDEEGSDDMMDMSSPTMTCGDDVMKVSMAEASAPGADIMFHDADSSGTITDGDMIHVSPDIDAGGDWNTVRLYLSLIHI